MSKFCGNCGMSNEDYAAVCGNCGTSFQNAPVQPQAKKTAVDVNAIKGQVTDVIGGVKKGDKGALIKGGIAVAVVVVAVILISSLFGGGPDKVIKKLIKAYDNEKPAAVVKLLPKFLVDVAEELDEDIEEGIESEMDDFYEYMEEELDTDKLTFKYKITDKEKMDDDDIEDMAAGLEMACEMADVDFDEDKIKAAYEYEIDVTVKGGGDSEEIELSAVVIKYGSKWYLASMEWE